jgi:solute carrier family 10 (sodium/bile acid cotransporter), member 7
MLKKLLDRLKIDTYILLIFAMVALASIFPVRDSAAQGLSWITNGVIGLLFFLYGGRLSRDAVIAGMTHWRLQLVVVLCTYLMFPALGLGLAYILKPWLTAPLILGIIYLSVLPSTVQSSIAFTSIAKGNIPAAVCAASLSNLMGVFITPMWIAAVLSIDGQGFSFQSLLSIVEQLLLPFVAGQLLRPWIAKFLDKYKPMLSYVDRGSILLVVYSAFSEGVVSGIWHQVDAANLLLLLLICTLLLAVVLALTAYGSKRLGFDLKDEIVIVFCGSKKSLASGLPMANILFPSATVSLIVLPLMLFHQIQLMACAVIARRYAEKTAHTE